MRNFKITKLVLALGVSLAVLSACDNKTANEDEAVIDQNEQAAIGADVGQGAENQAATVGQEAEPATDTQPAFNSDPTPTPTAADDGEQEVVVEQWSQEELDAYLAGQDGETGVTSDTIDQP